MEGTVTLPLDQYNQMFETCKAYEALVNTPVRVDLGYNSKTEVSIDFNLPQVMVDAIIRQCKEKYPDVQIKDDKSIWIHEYNFGELPEETETEAETEEEENNDEI